MKSNRMFVFGIVLTVVLMLTGSSFAQKIGYIHSQKIIAEFKDAIDAQKKVEELNQQWQKEGLDMQKQLQDMQDQFESQSLLLSESKKSEKAQEIQALYLKIQQFQQQKWEPGRGEIFAKEKEFMEPVLEKINAAIKKVGDAEGYDYIFDTASGNILYASDKMPDLTDKVLAELEKGSTTQK
ncbi:OmpH family outer membrane protein [candidate division KSB1 bacterium]|nr:OmpH family outer membrane protein [candidate division KSB1 bacterium]